MAKRVLIVGAGIGGLVATRALTRAGCEVELVEKAPAFGAVGAGIVLAENALSILDAVGLPVAELGRQPTRLSLRDERGRTLSTQEVAAASAQLGRMVVFARPELHAAMAAGASAARVRFGTTVEALAESPERVEARLSDGSVASYDLVIGADGINSQVRALALGPANPGRVYSGYTCVRFIAALPGLEEVAEHWGRGQRIGMAPLTGGRVYVFVVWDAPRGAPMPKWPEEISAMFSEFAAPAREVLSSARPQELLHHDLDDLERPVWGTRRTWLLGDAAHAMLPNLGQGAALAIEDAAVLAQSVALSGSIDEAGQRYRSARTARVTAAWRQSRQLGKVAQASRAIPVALRNSLMRWTPASIGISSVRKFLEPGRQIARGPWLPPAV